jgi:hypothetical protein
MAEYHATSDPNIFHRNVDDVRINVSADPSLPDVAAFNSWIEAGGVPDPNPLVLGSPEYSWGSTLAEVLG